MTQAPSPSRARAPLLGPGPAAAEDARTQPQAPTLRERLRAETAALHARVESHVRLLRPDVQWADYPRYLERIWGFLEPFEASLGEVPGFPALAQALGLELGRRRKAPLLREDLAALRGTTVEDACLPRCAALPTLTEPAHALGALYVLEGSSLGNQLLLRHLQARFPQALARAGAFLRGDGPRTGQQWQAFVQALGRFEAQTPGACDAVVAGAAATFEALSGWLGGTA